MENLFIDAKIEETNKLDMVSKMIGRNASDVMGQTKVCLIRSVDPKEFLRSQGMKNPKVIEQSIKIRKGEVLGLAGLTGSWTYGIGKAAFWCRYMQRGDN